MELEICADDEWKKQEFEKHVHNNGPNSFVSESFNLDNQEYIFFSSVVNQEPSIENGIDVFRFFITDMDRYPIFKAPNLPYQIEDVDLCGSRLSSMKRIMSFCMPYGSIQLFVTTIGYGTKKSVLVSTSQKANAKFSRFYSTFSPDKNRAGILDMFKSFLNESIFENFSESYFQSKLKEPIGSSDLWIICEKNRLCVPYDVTNNFVYYMYSIDESGYFNISSTLARFQIPFQEQVYENCPFSIVSLWVDKKHGDGEEVPSIHQNDFITTRMMNSDFKDLFNAMANEPDLIKRLLSLRIMINKSDEHIKRFYKSMKNSLYYGENRLEYFTSSWARDQYDVLMKLYPFYAQFVDFYYCYFIESCYSFYSQLSSNIGEKQGLAEQFSMLEVKNMGDKHNTPPYKIKQRNNSNNARTSYTTEEIDSLLMNMEIDVMIRAIFSRFSKYEYKYRWLTIPESEELKKKRIMMCYDAPLFFADLSTSNFYPIKKMARDTLKYLDSCGTLPYGLVPKILPQITI